MNRKLIEFDYTDKKGKHSHRVVYPIYQPGNKYFAIDLSEFDDNERAYYQSELDAIHEVMLDEIRQLGLANNYRYFIEDGVVNVSKDSDL